MDDSWEGDPNPKIPPRDPSAPLPAWATDPDNTLITEEEKLAIPEFFCGRWVRQLFEPLSFTADDQSTT